MEVALPAPTFILAHQWGPGKRRPGGRNRGIRPVQLEPVKAERREEGMEVVMPQLVEVDIRTGMQAVCLRLGVL